ncbi:MAG: YceI family protein [Wenzhouxiangella sp.]|jgi:polyisoprenoid-binding protein YceI|nr:YceI family protein [Wenzhouxiangella sp.]
MQGFRIATFASLIFLASSAWAEPREFVIDDEHFSIGFLINHVGYADQLGQFLEASGRFVWDEDANELHSGEVVVEAASVFTNHRERDRHLRSDDFLHAGRHGEIRFVATRWEPSEENRGTLHGDLTLLGQSHPVALEVTINRRDVYPFGHERYTVGMSARTTIRRSQWGMTYALEDGLVGDEVRMMLEFEAIAE